MAFSSMGTTEREEPPVFVRAILDSIGEAIFVHDTDTLRILFVNEAACRMFGYTDAEFTALDIGQLSEGNAPYRQQDAAELLARARKSEADRVFEWRARHRSGELFWVEVSVRYVSLDQGNRFVVTVRDIRERKRAQAAVADRDELLRKISSRVPGVVYQFRQFPDGRSCFPFASANIQDIYEVTPEEVREDAGAVFARLHPEDTPAVVASIQESAARLSIWRCDYRVNLPVRGLRWLRGEAAPDLLPDGSVLWHGYIADITERKMAEVALQASELRLRHLLDVVPGVAVQGYRADGTVYYWNRASQKLYGYTEAEALGRNLLDLIIPLEIRDVVRQAMRGMVETGVEIPAGEITLMRKDGSRVAVYSSHVVLRLPGKEPELFCLDMDLTELRRLEGERLALERQLLHAQKLESLGVLAGGIAHDFNNLLTAMMGNLDLALRDTDPASAAHPCLNSAVMAVQRAADLTRQMLAYSGRGRFIQQEVNLNELVEQNVGILRTAISGTASLSLHLSPSLPSLRGDLGQLQQVVMNLITNASEALMDRPGTIVLTTGVQDLTAEQLSRNRADNRAVPGRYVTLEVDDDGCGMDEATQARLFDPFFTTKLAGRGLGLSAVLGIVRGHGGAILVDSAPGRGTKFCVAFPVLLENDGATTKEVGSPDLMPFPLRGRRILLVDDEASIRLFGQRALGRVGAEVVLASNGLEALDVARAQGGSFSCAVVDMTMPQMDGVSCSRELKRLYPTLPVILSSGFTRDDIARRLKGVVVDGFISKPYELRALEMEIGRVLANSAAGTEEVTGDR